RSTARAISTPWSSKKSIARARRWTKTLSRTLDKPGVSADDAGRDVRRMVMRNLVVGVSTLVFAIACGGGGGTTQTNTPTTTSSATPATTGGTTTVSGPKTPLQDLIKKTLADFDAACAAHDAVKAVAAYAADATFTQPTHLGFNDHKK